MKVLELLSISVAAVLICGCTTPNQPAILKAMSPGIIKGGPVPIMIYGNYSENKYAPAISETLLSSAEKELKQIGFEPPTNAAILLERVKSDKALYSKLKKLGDDMGGQPTKDIGFEFKYMRHIRSEQGTPSYLLSVYYGTSAPVTVQYDDVQTVTGMIDSGGVSTYQGNSQVTLQPRIGSNYWNSYSGYGTSSGTVYTPPRFGTVAAFPVKRTLTAYPTQLAIFLQPLRPNLPNTSYVSVFGNMASNDYHKVIPAMMKAAISNLGKNTPTSTKIALSGLYIR